MFKITHIFYCKICGAEYSKSRESVLEEILEPTIPEGWIKFSDGYVCNNHNIIIENKVIQEE